MTIKSIKEHISVLQEWFTKNRDTIEAVAGVIAFALLPQLVALSAQLVINIANWTILHAQALAQAIASTYMFITAGWQSVAVFVAHSAQLTINAAKWLITNAAMAAHFILSGQLNAAWLISIARIALLSTWQGIVTAAQWAWNVAMSANPIGLIIIAVAGLVAGLIALTGHWGTVRNAAVSAIQPVIDVVKSLVEWMGKLPGVSSLKNIAKNLHIPGFAQGGIVTKPTLAMIGEGGEPEAVVPLSKMSSMGRSSVINIYGNISTQNGTKDIESLADRLGYMLENSAVGL